MFIILLRGVKGGIAYISFSKYTRLGDTQTTRLSPKHVVDPGLVFCQAMIRPLVVRSVVCWCDAGRAQGCRCTVDVRWKELRAVVIAVVPAYLRFLSILRMCVRLAGCGALGRRVCVVISLVPPAVLHIMIVVNRVENELTLVLFIE